jgi:hypothetical protein
MNGPKSTLLIIIQVYCTNNIQNFQVFEKILLQFFIVSKKINNQNGLRSTFVVIKDYLSGFLLHLLSLQSIA